MENLLSPLFNKTPTPVNPFLSTTTLSINLHALIISKKNSIQPVSGKINKFLTPSLDGTRYYTGGVWQKVLLLIYAIAEKLFGRKLFWENHCKVIDITKKSFKQIRTDLFLARNTYRQHLNYLCGETVAPEESAYLKAIRTITSWNQWIFPRLSRKIENWEDFLEIRGLQYLISLEQVIGEAKCPLPIQQLLNLSEKTKLSRQDKIDFKNQLNPWIKGINEKIKSSILPRRTHLLEANTLHRALHALIDIYTDSEMLNRDSQIKKQRDCLERNLTILGCMLLLEGDETQENFRREVNKRREIKIGKELVKLGEPLSAPIFSHEDRYHVYPLLRNEENEVVILPANPSMISKQRLYSQEKNLLIPFIECLHEDFWGRFKICPKMTSCLKNYQWITCEKLEGKDKNTAEKLIKLIEQFISINRSPKKLDIKKIFFNDKGELTLIETYIRRTQFYYCSLENFIFEATKGHPNIFKYIMATSKLAGRQEHTFFNNVVRNVLSRNLPLQENDISRLLKESIKEVKEEKEKVLIEEGLAVVEELEKQRNSILQAVQNENITNDIAIKNINKMYIEEYDQWNYGCNLPDHLVSDVIKKYKEKFN